jgi:hypothetical protein
MVFMFSPWTKPELIVFPQVLLSSPECDPIVFKFQLEVTVCALPPMGMLVYVPLIECLNLRHSTFQRRSSTESGTLFDEMYAQVHL